MARTRLPSFIACIVLILAINICIIGEIEFLFMTLFQIIISCSLVALYETVQEIWHDYKSEKEESDIGKDSQQRGICRVSSKK